MSLTVRCRHTYHSVSLFTLRLAPFVLVQLTPLPPPPTPDPHFPYPKNNNKTQNNHHNNNKTTTTLSCARWKLKEFGCYLFRLPLCATAFLLRPDTAFFSQLKTSLKTFLFMSAYSELLQPSQSIFVCLSACLCLPVCLSVCLSAFEKS